MGGCPHVQSNFPGHRFSFQSWIATWKGNGLGNPGNFLLERVLIIIRPLHQSMLEGLWCASSAAQKLRTDPSESVECRTKSLLWVYLPTYVAQHLPRGECVQRQDLVCTGKGCRFCRRRERCLVSIARSTTKPEIRRHTTEVGPRDMARGAEER